MSWEKYIIFKGWIEIEGSFPLASRLLVSTAANWKHPVHVNISLCQFDNDAIYQYNQEIYSGHNETTCFISRPNSFQLLKQQTVYRPLDWTEEFIDPDITLGSLFFLFIALSSCCYTERSNELFFFSVIILNWNAILKVEQVMGIQHLTVLRKFPLQCYNLLCHCERLDKVHQVKG